VGYFFLGLLVDSLTVVLGLRLTVDCLTNRPLIALLPRFAPLDAMGLTSSPSIPPSADHAYAYCLSRQVTAWPAYGGMTLFLAIGAVVDGVLTTSQTPLSGQC
jgi:hypothetical protein